MLASGFFPPEYAVSAADEAKELADTTIAVGTPNVTDANYSFAMIEIQFTESGDQWVPGNPFDASPRAQEWRDTANSQAIVMSDRAINEVPNTPGNAVADVITYHSIWTDPGRGDWHGSVLTNDGAVSFSRTPFGYITRYDNGPNNVDDELFQDDDGPVTDADDARMVSFNPTATLSAD